MGVAEKHFYRFTYLKSEHWQNLRLRKLAQVNARCRLCRERNLSNDVHHMRYRNLYDVQLSDLLVLFRKCHDRVHKAIEILPELKLAEGEEKTWIYKFRKKCRGIIHSRRMMEQLGCSGDQVARQIKRKFIQVRHSLKSRGLICATDQMSFNPSLISEMVKWYNSQWPTLKESD